MLRDTPWVSIPLLTVLAWSWTATSDSQDRRPPPMQGPFNDQTLLARSQDGIHWELDERVLAPQASVPELAFYNGTYFLYFMDFSEGSGLAVMTSKDAEHWTGRRRVTIRGLTARGAVDPDIVLTDDGKMRLFYFGSEVTQGDPASDRRPHKIYSAVSKDGFEFEEEKGVRYEEEQITDPDVVRFSDRWLMFVSRGPEIVMTESKDGLVFTRVGVIGHEGGVTGSIVIGDTLHVFYTSRDGIRSLRSKDLKEWKKGEIAIPAPKGRIVADASPLKTADGYLMAYKRARPNAPPPK